LLGTPRLPVSPLSPAVAVSLVSRLLLSIAPVSTLGAAFAQPSTMSNIPRGYLGRYLGAA